MPDELAEGVQLTLKPPLVSEKLVHLQLLLVGAQNDENVSIRTMALAFVIRPTILTISHVRIVQFPLKYISTEAGFERV